MEIIYSEELTSFSHRFWANRSSGPGDRLSGVKPISNDFRTSLLRFPSYLLSLRCVLQLTGRSYSDLNFGVTFFGTHCRAKHQVYLITCQFPIIIKNNNHKRFRLYVQAASTGSGGVESPTRPTFYESGVYFAYQMRKQTTDW